MPSLPLPPGNRLFLFYFKLYFTRLKPIYSYVRSFSGSGGARSRRNGILWTFWWIFVKVLTFRRGDSRTGTLVHFSWVSVNRQTRGEELLEKVGGNSITLDTEPVHGDTVVENLQIYVFLGLLLYDVSYKNNALYVIFDWTIYLWHWQAQWP